jgi:hypothetical protein
MESGAYHPEDRDFRGPNDLNPNCLQGYFFEILRESSSDALRKTSSLNWPDVEHS